MTLNDLVEKMKVELDPGAESVLKDLLKKVKSCKSLKIPDLLYGQINGFVWGMYATGYISVENHAELSDELIELCAKESRRVMKYRIEYANGNVKSVESRTHLLNTLKTAEPIVDIRKLYQSGTSDSVLEKYEKYLSGQQKSL